jgi:hypothetical protein
MHAHIIHKIPHARALATVRDAPLSKKVEMCNWEKVSSSFDCTTGFSPPVALVLAI